MYTKEEIKKAFWHSFHKSGELWFSYLGTDEENEDSTEANWMDFEEELKEIASEKKLFGFPVEHCTDSTDMIEQMKKADEGSMFLIEEKSIKQPEGDDIVKLTWAKIIRTKDTKDN